MRCQRVRIEEAVPGLKLARPVTSSTGIVVLGAGSELTDGLIARLQKIGTAAVYVEPDPLLAPVEAKTLEQLEQELAHRFRKVGGDPAMQRIRAAVIRQVRASRWQESGA